LLHQERPERTSFSAAEILDRLEREKAHPERRAGVQAHIYLHNVANVRPNAARYRLFYRLADGTYRLYRPGDTPHPDRRGKTKPLSEDLPQRYRNVLDWYETNYCAVQSKSSPSLDRILSARGLGQEIWTDMESDSFVEELRSGWDDPSREGHNPPDKLLSSKRSENAWKRVIENAGKVFSTKNGKRITYRVEGNSGLWFYNKDGKRINKRLWRGDFDKAIERCPLQKVTDISDCFDSSYLFALLTDERIRGNDW